jgi:hypothetical protein
LSYAVPVDTSIRYTITVIQIKNIFIFVIQVLFGLQNFKSQVSHSLWTKTSAILKKLVWPVKNTQFRALKSCYSFGNLSGNWIVKFISFILGRPEESSPGEEAEVGSDLCNSSEWSKARQPYLRSGRMRARQTSQERVHKHCQHCQFLSIAAIFFFNLPFQFLLSYVLVLLTKHYVAAMQNFLKFQ